MDIRQVEEQLALNLANAVFGDAPAGPILTAVVVTKQDLGAFLAKWSTSDQKTCPFAVVRVTAARDELDAATHASGSMGRGVRQTMRARVVVVAGSIAEPIPSPPPFTSVGNVAGDDVHGQGGVIGKSVSIGTRVGQGADRVAAEVVRQALGSGILVDQVHGLQGRVVGEGDLQTVFGVQLLGRAIDVEVTNGSTVQSYHSPSRFRGAVAGGTVTLSWLPVPARPDFLQYIVKRDGNQIYVGTAATFADVGVGAGVHTYTIVAQYDDVGRPPAASNRTSATISTPVTV